MKQITEEMGIHKEWYTQSADGMTLEKLPAFLNGLMNDYNHDYGTICHALAAGACATMRAMNADPKQGGITGFQAGCIMWEVLEHFFHVKFPARLLKMEEMLYPQYQDRFTTISESVWDHLRDKAQKNLQSSPSAHPDVVAHWEKIVAGVVPFGYSVSKG